MTDAEQYAVLLAFKRYAAALVALDANNAQRATLEEEVKSAEAEWRALARKAAR